MDYKEYVELHRQGVRDTWYDVLRPVLINECVPSYKLVTIDRLVDQHDRDKVSVEEIYLPYNDHFLYPEKYPKSNKFYRKAWNRHQKMNPHHWQYWVLMEDIENPKISAIEMDYEYVIEMLCDWQSASTYYGNTAHWWYETQKRNMILHPNTVKLIEKYIDYLD